MKRRSFYKRRRIDAILSAMAEYPLTLLIASTGYGKTTTVRQYLKGEDLPAAWVNVMGPDEPVFWEALCSALQPVLPELARALRPLGMPRDAQEMAQAAGIIRERTPSPLYLVIDDCQCFGPESAFYEWVRTLVFEEIDNFHLVLLTQTTPPLKVRTWESKGLCQILDGQTLAFTLQETQGYLAMRGIDLAPEIVSEIQRDSGGWIAILYFLCEAYHHSRIDYQIRPINQMFDENFLLGFDFQDREMLARLSVLPDFDESLAVQATGNRGVVAILEAMERENAFIVRDDQGVYHFHTLLKRYLMTRCPDDEGQRDFCERAAHWYLTHWRYQEALEFFDEAGCVEKMFDALNAPGYNWSRYTMEDMLYEVVSREPDTLWTTYPFSFTHVAFRLLTSGREKYAQIGRAVLEAIDAYCQERDFPGRNVILGNLILIRTSLGLNGDGNWNAHYQEALEVLAGDFADVMTASDPITFGMPMFVYLEYQKPGTLNKVVREDMACPLEHIIPGFGHGMDRLIQAEAALVRCQMAEAERFAVGAIAAAQEEQQYFLEMSAEFTLMRLAVYRGDYIGAMDWMEKIRGTAENALQGQSRVKDYTMVYRQVTLLSEGFLYTAIGQPEKVPEVFAERKGKSGWLMGSMGLGNLIRARLAALMGNAAIALSECEIVLELGQHQVHHSQLIRLSALILKSVVQRRLMMDGPSRMAMAQAVAEAELDGIRLPFAENAREILPILRTLHRRGEEPQEFLAKIIALCENREECRSNYVKPEQEAPLSPREREVLAEAAQGLTQKQIAAKLGIKEVTVKKHLISVYAKLGVSGKVAAIRMAQVKKII